MKRSEIKPLTEVQQAWKDFINSGKPDLWITTTISPSMFFKDQFDNRFPLASLLSDIQSANIPIPDGRNDIDALNELLRCKRLRHTLPDVVLPREADGLIKREGRLSEAALMKLNRYFLETAFASCPPCLTISSPMPLELVEKRFKYFFRHLNSTGTIYFSKFAYAFCYFEPNPRGGGWHIHAFLQRIHSSYATDIQHEMNRTLGNSKVFAHFEHGVIYPDELPASMLSKLVDSGHLISDDYNGKLAYVLTQSAEVLKEELEKSQDLSSSEVETFYKVFFNAKDGARYIARKDPSKNLEFKAFKISAR